MSSRISPEESRFETMMLGLRMNRGVSETGFARRHGVSLDSCYGEKLRDMEKRGLLIHDHGIWKMTARGFDIQNSVDVMKRFADNTENMEEKASVNLSGLSIGASRSIPERHSWKRPCKS